jgi:signal transduction histidine kinase/ActR/RegA family two-component response regulator
MNRIAHTHSFLSGGGEMGQRIREYDWDSSPLGNPSAWPSSLKITVRLMLSSGHAMFIWWGPELIQFYNDGYRASIGTDRHPSALGGKGRECWAEIWPTIGPQIETVMSGEGSVWRENHLVPITRNGKVEDVYWTYTYDPIYDEVAPNQVGGVLVIVSETTRHVLERQRHRAQEERWRQLFTKSPAFMCILTGPNHIFEYVNSRYSELTGHRDIINKPLREALPEVAEQGFGELLDFVYTSGQTHTGVATPIAVDGENQTLERQLYIDFVCQPIRNSDYEITGIFINGYDVTERILSEKSLAEQDSRKNEFLAMLAHELRNPLASIHNASELLKQTAQQGFTAYSLGDLISRQVGQLTRLIDDLLEVSRISQGRMELQKAPMQLDQAIKFSIESTSASVAEKNLHLAYQCDDSFLTIDGDHARIAQGLINIIINATKYTEENGTIRISLHREGRQAIITITDTGIGIASEMFEKIFELFQQVDNSIDRSKGGLGIGLSVVRTIIQMHGGTISVESPGLGQGSTFLIKLPLVPYRESSTAMEANPVLDTTRFLLIDDNEDATNSLAMLLKALGHQARVTYRGVDALEIIAKEKFDVLLLDIGLPDIDGYEVARRILAIDENAIIVAISGYGQAEDIRKALDAGFSGHLTKPVSLDELEHTVSELLGAAARRARPDST